MIRKFFLMATNMNIGGNMTFNMENNVTQVVAPVINNIDIYGL